MAAQACLVGEKLRWYLKLMRQLKIIQEAKVKTADEPHTVAQAHAAAKAQEAQAHAGQPQLRQGSLNSRGSSS